MLKRRDTNCLNVCYIRVEIVTGIFLQLLKIDRIFTICKLFFVRFHRSGVCGITNDFVNRWSCDYYFAKSPVSNIMLSTKNNVLQSKF